MIAVQRINTGHRLYQDERALRNKILLRPIGVPDHAWEMHDENSWHFIALDDGKVVGCVVLVPVEAGKAQLIQMAVDGSCQGKGIGKKLVHTLVEFAISEQLQEILCHARENVVDFYAKLGFEVYDDPFVEVGIVHRHMRMLL